MINIYKNKSIFAKSPANFSKLKQKLGLLIKQKGKYIGEIFNNNVLVKGGVYLLKHKCGKKSCKCATTSYRHEHHYLYRSENGKNKVIYIKPGRVEILKRQTENYKRFRKAREMLVKTEGEIMEVVNKIEKIRTIKLEEGKKNEKR